MLRGYYVLRVFYNVASDSYNFCCIERRQNIYIHVLLWLHMIQEAELGTEQVNFRLYNVRTIDYLTRPIKIR